MAEETLLMLASDIVSAHVSNNAVATEELPALIKAVYGSLTNLGKEPVAVAEKREPAVSIRVSVKPDHITCLECGTKMKMLKRHLGVEHNLTPEDYKARWNLAKNYPLVAPNYAATRKELAVRTELWRKRPAKDTPAAAKPSAAKPTKVAAPKIAAPAALEGAVAPPSTKRAKLAMKFSAAS